MARRRPGPLHPVPLGMTNTAAAYKLSDRLASMDFADHDLLPVVDGPETLLQALVLAADAQGRYYADVALIYGRACYKNLDATKLDVYEWREALLEGGDIKLSPDALNCYGGIHLVLHIQHKYRFQRWANRAPIPKAVRELVYQRDGFKCVKCATTEGLSIDHVIPWSRGGPDHPDNFQTLCRSCNSSKGNKMVDA